MATSNGDVYVQLWCCYEFLFRPVSQGIAHPSNSYSNSAHVAVRSEAISFSCGQAIQMTRGDQFGRPGSEEHWLE